jgi:glutaredoxin
VILSCAISCQSGRKTAATDAGQKQPDGTTTSVVYSYVDDFGKIRMAATIDEVPEAYRDQVVITDTATSRSRRLAADRILVVDLRKESGGKPLNYSVVDLDALQHGPEPERDIKDPGALGSLVVQKAADRVKRALGLSRPAGSARVILYSAPWCGFCKKAAEHLKEKGVQFEEKDIEKDRFAAVELSRKLRQAGLTGGGVPVLDIGGTIVVGFNKGKIDRLLDGI